MKCNDQAGAREVSDAEKCDMCGRGYLPDERMNFEGGTTSSLIHAVRDHLAVMQDKMYSCECILAKLMEMEKATD